MELFAQIVTQLGFPIALVIWFLYKDAKQQERAQTQWNKVSESIDRNTATLNDISAYIKYGKRPEDNMT